MNQHKRMRVFSFVLVATIALASLTGCAAKSAKMTMAAGAGVGQCDYDPKDRNRFAGSVDAGDTCFRVVGRVRMDQEPPQRLIPEKGDPVILVSNGPFGEVGYSDLGETKFAGTWMLVPDYGTLKATAWHAAVGYGYPLTRRLGIFGRVGYAFWDVDEDEIYDGIPESHSASGNNLLYAAGLNVGLSRRWVLDAEWTRYQDVGKVGETGQGDIDMVTATVLYRFGR